MADTPDQVADDLAAMGAKIRAAVAAELDRQAELSKDAMAADTPRDRGLTAESYVHNTSQGGMRHRVVATEKDKAGRYIATIIEFGWNDGRPDAIVERAHARADGPVQQAVMDAVVDAL